MNTTYRLKANELDSRLLRTVKTLFADREIEIVVTEVDETAHLLRSPANKRRLLRAADNVKHGRNVVAVNLADLG